MNSIRERLQKLMALEVIRNGGEAAYTDDQLITLIGFVAARAVSEARQGIDRGLVNYWELIAPRTRAAFVRDLRACAADLARERAAFIARSAGGPLPAAMPAPVPVDSDSDVIARASAPVLLAAPYAAIKITVVDGRIIGASAGYAPGKRVSAVGYTVTEAVARLRENIAAKQAYPYADISRARAQWLDDQQRAAAGA